MTKPFIAVTVGDPAGVGPEIAVRAVQDSRVTAVCRPVLIGSLLALEAAERVCRTRVHFVPCAPSDDWDALSRRGTIVLVPGGWPDRSLRFGEIQEGGGQAAFAAIRAAVELAKTGRVRAVATAPIHKEALKAAGVSYIGHTEIFAGLCGVADPLTMFETGCLRIFFLTRHVSLRHAVDLVTADRVLGALTRCSQALRRLGFPKQRIAVAGLNPHCGEHGLFGDEEGREIEPAVKKARDAGLDVFGPIGADSVFAQAAEGKYDAVLSLYHDQGHIAAKTLDFHRTISLTLGLPFLRTSVDHGTAFDIAGKGIASAVSMVEAIKSAARYAERYS